MRIVVGLAIAFGVLGASAGCASDVNDSSSGADDTTTTTTTPSSPTTSTTTTTASSTIDEVYPVPPGASGWPSRDLASCDDLGSVNEKELFVRVAVATPACVTFSEANEVLVIAAGTVKAGVGQEQPLTVPGFDGEATSIMAPVSQGAAYLVKPTAEQTNYLVVWDGGTEDPIERIIADLFATE